MTTTDNTDLIYCVKCKQKTANVDAERVTMKNGRGPLGRCAPSAGPRSSGLGREFQWTGRLRPARTPASRSPGGFCRRNETSQSLNTTLQQPPPEGTKSNDGPSPHKPAQDWNVHALRRGEARR